MGKGLEQSKAGEGMASSGPRLVSNSDEPTDIRFYRLSVEREQARTRRLARWFIAGLALSLLLNAVLFGLVQSRSREEPAPAPPAVAPQELDAVRDNVGQLSAALDRLGGRLDGLGARLDKVSESKIGSARKEMAALRRCLNDARRGLRRAVTQGGKRDAGRVLRRLKLPAC